MLHQGAAFVCIIQADGRIATKELALLVLEEFYKNGLYVSEQYEEGYWNVSNPLLCQPLP